MKKSVVISVELETGEQKEKRTPFGDQNVIVIPQGDGYAFFYFDNKQAEKLTLKQIKLLQVRAIQEPPKKKKLLLEKNSDGGKIND